MAVRRTLALVLASIVLAAPAHAGGLSGSRASMVRQHAVAVGNDYDFVKTPAQVHAQVDEGALVSVEGDGDFVLSGVSYPYARPEVKRFVEWLAARYRAATGSRLVVTSLTRPTSLQPRNASPLSVHPAGMAVDLRVPAAGESRAWLERTLLELERAQVLDVTREYRPPHLHVAVFPEAFAAYAERHLAPPVAVAPAPRPSAPAPVAAATPAPAPDAEGIGGLLLALAATLPLVAGAALTLGRTGRRARAEHPGSLD